MNKISILLIPFLIVIGACAPFESELPTQTPATPTLLPPSIVPDIPFIGDGGLISGQPCTSPCFYGVRIGETKFDHVISILKSNGIYPCNQDTNTKIKCGSKVIVWANPLTSLVDSIGYYPDTDVSVGELISKYDAPDILHVIPTEVPEAPTTSMLLFFDSMNMRIHLPETEDFDYVLSEQTKIKWVTYLDSTIYSDLRENIFSQRWVGYGTYHPKLDP